MKDAQSLPASDDRPTLTTLDAVVFPPYQDRPNPWPAPIPEQGIGWNISKISLLLAKYR